MSTDPHAMLPVYSSTVDWRDDKRKPAIALLLGENAAMWLTGALPSEDDATRQLQRAILEVFDDNA